MLEVLKGLEQNPRRIESLRLTVTAVPRTGSGDQKVQAADTGLSAVGVGGV